MVRTIYKFPLLVFLCASVVTHFAHACAFHGIFEDDKDIPRGATLMVIQNYSAVQQQLLPSIERLEGEAGFRRVWWWLNLLSRELRTNIDTDSYIYLADVQLWAKMPADANLALQLESSPDEPDYPLLMLTSEALHALVSKQMTLGEVMEINVLKMSEEMLSVIN